MRGIDRSARRVARAVLMSLCLVVAPVAAQAESPAMEFGKGVGTFLTNVVYGPAKLLYAIGGGTVATIAYAFSGGDEQVARPIVNASLRGDYILSREQIFGPEEIEFVGRQPEHERARGGGWDVAAPSEPEGF